MLDSIALRLGLLGAALAVFLVIWRGLYPKPYPGIPYNDASARRITGDLPDLFRAVKEKNEPTDGVFTITTRKLGTPIAQVLFPRFRKPLVVLEDPREIEDILVRRSREFDRAATVVSVFEPMFAHGTVAQFTTPELKAQKRLWADVMSTSFLRKVAAPNIHKSACELLELWRLRASTLNKDEAFDVHDDFKNAALDAIWVVVVGDEPGTVRHDISKIQSQLSGAESLDESPSVGVFLKEQVAYISDQMARAGNSPLPTLIQKLETYRPRYRRFRLAVSGEMRRAMKKAIDRYQSLDVSSLEDDAVDNCALDLLLRRQILQAKKAGVAVPDLANDDSILDELFVILVGGHDSTANTLCWLVRFMEAYPTVQSELRAVLKAAFPGPGVPSAAQILGADLPYLDAACEESFRLSGTAKGGLRQALVDTQVLGCPVPKGAEILMNFHVVRPPVPVDLAKRSETSRAAIAKRDRSTSDGFEDTAGRDLGSFQPRRWLTKDEETGKEAFNAYALTSLAFGGGYRGCFGRKLAMMEFKIVTVLLILTFEFLALPEKYQSMAATEKIFREPDFPYARIKVLRESGRPKELQHKDYNSTAAGQGWGRDDTE